MAGETFTLYSDEIVNNSMVMGNDTYELIVSPEQNNNADYNSLRVIVEYDDFLPAITGTTYGVTAMIESSNQEVGANQRWFPIAYQFREYKGKETQAKIRELILQPDFTIIDAGVDDVVYVADVEQARISRTAGKLGGDWRIRILLKETGYGGAGAFQSGKINVYGERFNV